MFISIELVGQKAINVKECKSIVNQITTELQKKYKGHEKPYFDIENGLLLTINKSCKNNISNGLKNNFVKTACITMDTKSTTNRKRKITLNINVFQNEQQAIFCINLLNSLIVNSKTNYSMCVDSKLLANEMAIRMRNVVITFNNQYYENKYFESYVKDFNALANKK